MLRPQLGMWTSGWLHTIHKAVSVMLRLAKQIAWRHAPQKIPYGIAIMVSMRAAEVNHVGGGGGEGLSEVSPPCKVFLI